MAASVCTSACVHVCESMHACACMCEFCKSEDNLPVSFHHVPGSAPGAVTAEPPCWPLRLLILNCSFLLRETACDSWNRIPASPLYILGRTFPSPPLIPARLLHAKPSRHGFYIYNHSKTKTHAGPLSYFDPPAAVQDLSVDRGSSRECKSSVWKVRRR